ncbi:GerAB/ArcD/ProY family transporter [Neobacillus niacini]|uniref:GerAB/ArcD/ProY family transporter n=1 Tax=Neobacillus niacini TaxID=86668 RepID=UPI002854BC0D|nr:GerAB/ArcD/ProY family transporter [Neobacillus niacini]MDR6998363.1 spore germination protein (amino acid permease) [Neobacillus niacini]
MKEESISNRQLLFLVLLMQIGSRILSLPYMEAKYAGIYGWMAALIGGIASQLSIMLIWNLGKRYPNQHIFQYVYTLAGKPIGSVLTFLYAIYFSYSALIVALLYIEKLSRWVLPKTPWWVLLLLIFIASGYAAMSSLRLQSFISLSLAPILIAGYLTIVVSGLREADIRNILPIGHSGGSSFANGVFQGYTAGFGYDLLLYAFPFVKSQSSRKLLGAITWANGLTTLIYVTVVLICALNFTPDQMSNIPEPTVFILKQLKWDVVQSIDMLFIALWFSILAATVYVYLFLAAKAVCHIGAVHKEKHVLWVWICTGICFAIGCWIPEENVINAVSGKPYEIMSVVCIVFIPLLLLLIPKVSRLRGRNI